MSAESVFIMILSDKNIYFPQSKNTNIMLQKIFSHFLQDLQ